MPPSAHLVLGVRALNDKLCEKRKAAAFEIEKIVKPLDILYSFFRTETPPGSDFWQKSESFGFYNVNIADFSQNSEYF